MLLYVTIGSNDLFRSRLFYDAVLAELGYKRQRENIEEVGYAADGDTRCRLWVVTPFNRKAATIGNGSMVALEAPSRAAVDAFHRGRFFLVQPAAGGHRAGMDAMMLAAAVPSAFAFHRAGLGHGGTDEGLPGLRPFHADFYAAYLRDPDGNKISAVCERPE